MITAAERLVAFCCAVLIRRAPDASPSAQGATGACLGKQVRERILDVPENQAEPGLRLLIGAVLLRGEAGRSRVDPVRGR